MSSEMHSPHVLWHRLLTRLRGHLFLRSFLKHLRSLSLLRQAVDAAFTVPLDAPAVQAGDWSSHDASPR